MPREERMSDVTIEGAHDLVNHIREYSEKSHFVANSYLDGEQISLLYNCASG